MKLWSWVAIFIVTFVGLFCEDSLTAGDLEGYVVLARHDPGKLDPFRRRGAITALPIDHPRTYGIPNWVPRQHRHYGWTPEGNQRTMHYLADIDLKLIFLDGIDLSDRRFIGHDYNPVFFSEMIEAFDGNYLAAMDFINNDPSVYFKEVVAASVDGYRPLANHGIDGLPGDAVVMVRDHRLMTQSQHLAEYLRRARPPRERVRFYSVEVQARYRRLQSYRRLERLRSSGRALKQVGKGMVVGGVVQIGGSEALKATTDLDDDTANLVMMPVSEAAGMIILDGVTVSTASSASSGGVLVTGGAASTALAGAAGGVAVVTESTRRCAENHQVKLAYDESSIAMSGVMAANLIRRNGELEFTGEITYEEMVARNDAILVSARREGDQTVG